MKIAIITTRSKSSSDKSVVQQAALQLIERGAQVLYIIPEDNLIDVEKIKVEHDLYILKSGTEAAMALAWALHLEGAGTLNPYPAVAEMKDKIIATRRLQEAQVPLPETYFAQQASQFSALLDRGPLVIKPYRGGSQGRGVSIVHSKEELADIEKDQGLLFAQRYHKPDGRDHKIYRIGEKIFGVRRVWPPTTYEDKLGEPFDVTPEMKEITLRCGSAFGIDVYGIDIIISEGKAVVVDINTFPGFKGVPDAATLLADYIHAACLRAMELKTEN
jgi:ribosomal protein S6--L-glutamate ligase